MPLPSPACKNVKRERNETRVFFTESSTLCLEKIYSALLKARDNNVAKTGQFPGKI